MDLRLSQVSRVGHNSFSLKESGVARADNEPAAYKHPVYNGLNCKLSAGAENKLKTPWAHSLWEANKEVDLATRQNNLSRIYTYVNVTFK